MINKPRYINNNHEYLKKSKSGLRVNNSYINSYNRGNMGCEVHVWGFKPIDNKNLIGEKYIESFSDICYSNEADEISVQFEKPVIRRSGIILRTRTENYLDMKMLVVRGRDGGIWSLPKGRMKEDESEEECAKRELYEETGIEVGEISHLQKCKLGKNIYFVMEVEEMDFKKFTIWDNNEVDKVEWKSIMELRSLNCNKDIRSILQFPERKYQYHSIIFQHFL